MAGPFAGIGKRHPVGRHHRDVQRAGGRQHRMTRLSGPELRIQVAGAAETHHLLEKADIAGKEDEAVAVVRQKSGKLVSAKTGRLVLLTVVSWCAVTSLVSCFPAFPPMYMRNGATECSPAALSGSQRYRLTRVPVSGR